MEGKEHFLNSSAFTYVWVMGVSVWGGLVDYFEKKETKKENFSLGKLCAHLLSASFAGLMTFYLCQYGNVPEPLTGVLCGIAAHMGTPALLKMKIVQTFLEKGKMD